MIISIYIDFICFYFPFVSIHWLMGNYILYHQQLHGWGSKTIKQLAKAIRLNFPEKKGYSERNLTYMCQFARTYPLRVLQNFIETDAKLIAPSVKKIEDEVLQEGGTFRRKKIFNFMIQYLCPIFAAIILFSSVANAFGWISM